MVSPYHYRLDWQIWFAAMADYRTQPWLVHLVYKLLHADPGALSLLAGDPFDGRPPRRIRADLYEYEFAPAGEEGWWRRRRLGEYLPALAAGDPALRRVVEGFGWPLLPGPPRSPSASSAAGARMSLAAPAERPDRPADAPFPRGRMLIPASLTLL